MEILAERFPFSKGSFLGDVANKSCPKIVQLFVSSKTKTKECFEAKLYKVKKFIDNNFHPEREIYCLSLSGSTIVYKGLVMPENFGDFYTDLNDKEYKTAAATFHIRFSTNTSPKWHLAQPYRVLAHNGEINTISGNRNWALARTSEFHSEILGDISSYQPLVSQDGSDSSSLDHMLDLLTIGGVNIARAARMLIPPSWQNTDLMNSNEKAFHEFNSMHMEAWDGPALICFHNKEFISCFLDRNGLRPARIEYFDDDSVSVSSEFGSNIGGLKLLSTDRLGPGGLFMFDRNSGEVLKDQEVDAVLSKQFPYLEWLKDSSKHLEANLHEYSGPQMLSLIHI